MNRSANRIVNRLVILAPNWLGDAVMALPAIADVRRAFPEATITIAARSSVAPLFAMVDDVDDTIVLSRAASMMSPSTWQEMGAELAGGRFEAALLLPNSIHSALIANRAGIADVWGYRGNWRGRFLTRAIAPPSGIHQIAYYQHLVDALGCANGSSEPRVNVPGVARDAARTALTEAGWDGRAPLVALAPGAAYGGAKKWPSESFAELASTLAADGISCVMVGSPADAGTGHDVARAFTGVALLNLMGRTDLATLAGVLSLSRTLVTNDSGAMHLAAAAGVSVTAVFGPTNERATRPLGDAHVVLTHDIWCRPCMLRECPLDHGCMRGVAPGVVLDAARRTL
jgi:lipopolysaccharide heptosyltransferase II